MAENENQETNMSFKLSLMKVTQLSFPIASLCDSEFNPEGFGLLEFSDTGLDITVRNTLAIAELFLPTSGLTDYRCKNPILGKIININPIYHFLIEAIHHHSPNPSLDHIILTVFHLHGSNKLTFTYGSPPIKKEIRLKESNGEFERFPAIVEFNCEAHLNSTILRLMIRNVQQRHDRLVLVRITKELFTIHLGTGNYPVFETKPNDNIDKDCSVRILTEDEQEHHALFQMLHLEAMKKAANAGLKFFLRFLTQPENHIMIRYNLQQLGFFVFLQKAVLIVPMPEKPPPKPPQQPPPKPPQQPPQMPPHKPPLYKPPRKAPRRKRWCRDYDRVLIQ